MSPSSHLQLVRGARDTPTRRNSPPGRVTLPRTPELQHFLRATADRGLDSSQALRLAIERALVLIDIDGLLLERSFARRLLCSVAKRAGVHRPLPPERAVYLRRLIAARPLPERECPDTLTVQLPQELLARARGVVPLTALGEDAIAEMIAWEQAAVLDGRTMAEWSLLALARPGARSRDARWHRRGPWSEAP
jgi:hypothetical protein